MRKIIATFALISLLFVGIIWYADASNPYGKFSFVSSPFVTSLDTNQHIKITQKYPVTLYKLPNWLAMSIDQLQEFGRILPGRFFQEKSLSGNTSAIINQIHALRFDPSKPYIISASHFGELYVRNFGIFYSALLDPRIGSSQTDWINRERVGLQTVALDLELLKQAGKEYTTFTPITPHGYVGINIYQQPSDSLFALLWTLHSLTEPNFITNIFPGGEAQYTLQTVDAGKKLISTYNKSLTSAVNQYLTEITDPKTGLIKKEILLSSARDQIKRQSSFYDNVIAWSTAKLATSLGLSITCPTVLQTNNSCDFDKWKQKIISAFWDKSAGIFLDDLSPESVTNHLYSGDAFIVISTQFLDLTNPQEKEMLEKEISYVQTHNLDKPFPLFYATTDQLDKLYFFNKYFATSYMGKSIWSHWGIEYIKALLLLSKDNPQYLSQAQKGLQAYTQNIQKYGGYPELYDKYGKIFQTSVYKSLLQTGWVVNYEQAQVMLKGINK
ncbi:MAG TPA: hypothetical protein VF820_00885 [Patescibacteria group bacterium]